MRKKTRYKPMDYVDTSEVIVLDNRSESGDSDISIGYIPPQVEEDGVDCLGGWYYEKEITVIEQIPMVVLSEDYCNFK